jgi:hypothetical protein
MSRVVTLFEGQNVRCSIDVELKDQQLSFENVEEIRQSREVPGSLTSFSVWAHGNNHILWVHGKGFLGFPPMVRAEADNEAWCAGAVEVVYQFIAPYRIWYSWYRGWPIGAMFLLSLNIPIVLLMIGRKQVMEGPFFVIAWLGAIAVFAALYFGRDRLLPAAVLRMSPEESAIRRYMPELTLIVAILALLLTIIGWFVK